MSVDCSFILIFVFSNSLFLNPILIGQFDLRYRKSFFSFFLFIGLFLDLIIKLAYLVQLFSIEAHLSEFWIEDLTNALIIKVYFCFVALHIILGLALCVATFFLWLATMIT